MANDKDLSTKPNGHLGPEDLGPVLENHDHELQVLIAKNRRTRRILLVIGVVAFILIVAAGIYNAIQQRIEIHRDEIRLVASCAVAKDIGTAPVIVAPGQTRPSELGIKIIADFRNAYIKQDCPGHIPVPSASLIRWANYYNIHLEG